MPAIDIISMHGEMPRVLPHMLPDGYSALAQNCHFRFGVITPVNDDQKSEVIFDMNPETLFLYSQNKWFTWSGIVDVVRSPVAQDPYGRVYYTDGQYPKVTSAQIATSGSGPYPVNSYRLGVPAPESAITCSVLNPPPVEGTEEGDAKDDETRFYTQTFVTAYGEEGPPGPQSSELTVKQGGSVDLTMQPPPLQNSNITRIRHILTTFDTAYNDTATDTLYLVKGRELSVSQGANTPLPFIWRSKTFIAQESTSFSCLRIKAPYPERVGISVFADGQPVIQLSPGVLSGSVLKLPPVTGREWYLEVAGFGQVERVTLSTSMTEMPA
ncbi:hypothetical protein DKU28_05510 [Salmonella enterica subsp. enterica serovar Reading]|nr:hypothetical protein [Salmonella enterica subsp. enterica serovar Reading]